MFFFFFFFFFSGGFVVEVVWYSVVSMVCLLETQLLPIEIPQTFWWFWIAFHLARQQVTNKDILGISRWLLNVYCKSRASPGRLFCGLLVALLLGRLLGWLIGWWTKIFSWTFWTQARILHAIDISSWWLIQRPKLAAGRCLWHAFGIWGWGWWFDVCMKHLDHRSLKHKSIHKLS